MGDKLCFGCFEPINDEIKCPHCGHKQQSPYSPSYIAPGTMLKEKYQIGKVLSHNGEGVTYLAFDTVFSCKVTIKEFMPENLCSRDQETQALVVNTNSTVQYKSYMDEFTELNKKLARLRTIDHIQPVLDMFNDNNTTYVVFEYLEGQNLIQYLKENGGELSWRKVQKLFPPLFTSLSQLHNAGIIHRGISPNTIYVTSKGELKLVDFCIAAVRTNKTELNAELFKGYAAPEQYSPAAWQGTWTDVYGISSVLYRILTATKPTEPNLRNEADDLTAPSSLNPEIPDNVSEAIINGMKMSGDERIQTINDFVTLTFRPADDSSTRTVDIGSIAPKNVRETVKKQKNIEAAAETTERYERPERTEREPRPQRERMIRPAPEPEEFEEEFSVIERVRTPLIIAMLLLVVVVFILFFIRQLNIKSVGRDGFSTNLPSLTTVEETAPAETEVPEEEETDNGFYIADIVPATLAPAAPVTTAAEVPSVTEFTTGGDAGSNIQMINFVGRNYDDVKLSSLVNDLNITIQYDNQEGVPAGQIIEQSIKEGTWIKSGEAVTLTVNKGDGSAPAVTVTASDGSSVTHNVVAGVVPNYKKSTLSCYPLMEYLQMLDEAGIPYKAVPLEDASGYPSKGYVVGTEPGAGSAVDGVLTVRYTPSAEYNSVIYSGQ